MKSTLRYISAAGAVLLIAAAAVRADGISDKVYVNGDVGAAFLQDITIKNSGGAELQFDTGVRADVGIGYNISDALAAELDAGVVWNQFKHSSDSLYQVPLMANLIYTLPVKWAVVPYIGAGVGGVAGIVDASGFSDTDFVFGYQAMAGIKYAVTKDVDIGVGYKFLGTTDYSWTDHGTTVKTEEAFTHSVLATLTVRF
jgi:opacity protein-like surface antigen